MCAQCVFGARENCNSGHISASKLFLIFILVGAQVEQLRKSTRIGFFKAMRMPELSVI